MVSGLLVTLFGPVVSKAFWYIYLFYPIWLPFFLVVTLVKVWMRYRRTKFITEQGKVLLEISIPREITKSPQAMEVVLVAMYLTGNASYAETYIDGKVRAWVSLEMVSFGGQIHFYIWTHKKLKNLIEAQIYAQYPEVTIKEVADYAEQFQYDPNKTILWGTYFKKEKKDEKDAYPIKTYVDYGLDQNPKEEHKVDPMTATLEYLGSMGKGEQAWIQILIQAHKKEGIKEGRLFSHPDWKDAVKAELDDLRSKLINEVVVDGKPSKRPRQPTKGEADIIAAVERSQNKLPFETMIRGFYIADKEVFNAIGITGLIGSTRHYNSPHLNGFKLGLFTDHPDNCKDFFRYFFKKTGLKIRRRMERQMLNAYKLRSFFQFPYKNYRGKAYIMTTEELATIYHFPGQVALTPGLPRIPSKRSQAPANLPV